MNVGSYLLQIDIVTDHPNKKIIKNETSSLQGQLIKPVFINLSSDEKDREFLVL